jgi:aspartyl-tRNA(Asn)/glutamyl-tRNA(Gln) amidotransferase subunit A
VKTELHSLTGLELAGKIRRKEVSAREAVADLFERIERLDPPLHAYLSLNRDLALARADEIDSALARGEAVGRLAGVPVAVKDNLCTADFPTTCASRILQNFRPPYDACVVEALRREGAIIVGKTNLDEFAMGSSTENSAFGPSRNPWDTAKIPGGSSGGSAVAVAADLAHLSLGSDTGGSIRQPAALCGVVGLKPTYGRVSRYGLVAFASSLDQVGPITKDVRDAALLMEVIAHHDRRDSTSLPAPAQPYLEIAERPFEPVRIGIVKEFFGEGLDPEIAAAVREMVAVLEKLGAKATEVSLPHNDYAIGAYYILAPAEASSNLARYDGVHYGYRSPAAQDILSVFARSRAEGFGAEVQRRILLGTYALSSGYYEAYYLKAAKVRRLILQDFDAAFQKVDFLIGPTTPGPAFGLGERTANPLEMYLADIYTISINLVGAPAISIPCGFTRAGLPIGAQIMANAMEEPRLLQLARAYERETNWRAARRPNL